PKIAPHVARGRSQCHRGDRRDMRRNRAGSDRGRPDGKQASLNGRRPMKPQRLEAFTDGVMAIIITIMVLEIKVPHGAEPAAFMATVPILLTYLLSFVNVGIFWNNHHHVLHTAARINGRVLWANMFLLFWMSLVPFVIRWIDESGFQPLPTAAYGVVLAMSAI